MAQFIRKPSTYLCGDLGVLKKDRALEILAAVQTRAQNEVAVEQRAGFAEKCEQIFAHLGSARRWRAVLKAWPLLRIRCSGGSPKTSADDAEHVNCGEEEIARCVDEQPFDEPSNGAREPRALPGSGILTRCIIRRFYRVPCGGNYFDFHIGSSRQRGNLNGGTGRRILFEIRAVYLVYALEVSKIR